MNDTTGGCQNASVTEPQREVAFSPPIVSSLSEAKDLDGKRIKIFSFYGPSRTPVLTKKTFALCRVQIFLCTRQRCELFRVVVDVDPYKKDLRSLQGAKRKRRDRPPDGPKNENEIAFGKAVI